MNADSLSEFRTLINKMEEDICYHLPVTCKFKSVTIKTFANSSSNDKRYTWVLEYSYLSSLKAGFRFPKSTNGKIIFFNSMKEAKENLIENNRVYFNTVNPIPILTL